MQILEKDSIRLDLADAIALYFHMVKEGKCKKIASILFILIGSWHLRNKFQAALSKVRN